MIAIRKRLDIDRQMYWIECPCGAAFYHCERQPKVKCPGCGKVEPFAPIREKFESEKK